MFFSWEASLKMGLIQKRVDQSNLTRPKAAKRKKSRALHSSELRYSLSFYFGSQVAFDFLIHWLNPRTESGALGKIGVPWRQGQVSGAGLR